VTRLSIAVLAHEEEGSIARMLASVVRQTAWRARRAEDRELVVYANGCRDRTAEVARRFAEANPGVRVVETAERGKSQAWNAVRGELRRDVEWWIFADADVLLDWRAVERLLAEGARSPSASVVSSMTVASARYVPLSHRGCLESSRIESERWKDPRRMVSARLYAIRREIAEAITLPPGLLNEDLFLTRLLGSERIVRCRGARVIAREPAGLGDIVRYQVRTRIGSFQARAAVGPPVDSNKSASHLRERLRQYRRLSWKALAGKLAWMPLRLFVEWRARRTRPEALDAGFWMTIDSGKLVSRSGTFGSRSRSGSDR
jgi:glycosyltransferase involved in cell wall biosynthesis